MRFTAVYILAQFRILQCWSYQNFVEFSIQSNSNQSPAFSPNQDTISTSSPPPEVQTNFANFPSSSVQTYHLFGNNFYIVWNLLPIDTSHFYKFKLLFWQDSPFSFFSLTLTRDVYINVWSEKVWSKHFFRCSILYTSSTWVCKWIDDGNWWFHHWPEFVNELMMVIHDLINLIILITWSDNSLDWFS